VHVEADRIFVFGDRFRDFGVGGRLLPSAHLFDQVRIPLVAALEGDLLDEVRPAAERRVETIDPDRLVGPFARQAQLAPGADILFGPARRRRRPFEAVGPTAGAFGAENSVDLFERKPPERIVLVHDENGRRLRAFVERAGQPDLERVVPIDVAERHEVRPPRRMTQKAEVICLRHDAADAARVEEARELDVGMIFVKGILPIVDHLHHVRARLQADHAPFAVAGRPVAIERILDAPRHIVGQRAQIISIARLFLRRRSRSGGRGRRERDQPCGKAGAHKDMLARTETERGIGRTSRHFRLLGLGRGNSAGRCSIAPVRSALAAPGIRADESGGLPRL